MQKGNALIFLLVGIFVLSVTAGAFYLGKQTTSKPPLSSVVNPQDSMKYKVEENLLGDYNKIIVKDVSGAIIVEDLVKANEKEIGYNTKFKCQCSTSFKNWVDATHFIIKIGNGGGEEYEYIVDASTGKVDESSFKQTKKIDETTNWKTYNNGHYSISYPTDWKINQDPYFIKHNPNDLDIWSPEYEISHAGFPLKGVHIIFFFAKTPFSETSPGLVSKEEVIWMGQKANLIVHKYESNALILQTNINGVGYELVMPSASDQIRETYKETFLKVANTIKIK